MWQVQSIHKCSKCGSTDSSCDSRIVEDWSGENSLEYLRKCNECNHEKVESTMTWTRQPPDLNGVVITIEPIEPPETVHLF